MHVSTNYLYIIDIRFLYIHIYILEYTGIAYLHTYTDYKKGKASPPV